MLCKRVSIAIQICCYNDKLPFLEFYLDQNLYHCVVPVSKKNSPNHRPALYILLCSCINANVFQGKLHDIVMLGMSVVSNFSLETGISQIMTYVKG